MGLELGAIVEGKVTGTTKFGAFVALPDGKSGLVHISELANAFVADVNEHVKVGDVVKVKVLSISPEGKINLSVKRALEPAAAEVPPRRSAPPRADQPRREAPSRPAPEASRVAADPPGNDQSFEDRLKKFMQESDSRIADNRMYADRPRRSRRR